MRDWRKPPTDWFWRHCRDRSHPPIVAEQIPGGEGWALYAGRRFLARVSNREIARKLASEIAATPPAKRTDG